MIPLALVPAVSTAGASVGTSVGASYGKLETVFSAMQLALVLLLGWARQAGGFRLGLRLMLGCATVSVPSAAYAIRSMRAVEVATRLLHQSASSRDLALLEAAELSEGSLLQAPADEKQLRYQQYVASCPPSAMLSRGARLFAVPAHRTQQQPRPRLAPATLGW